MKNPLSDLGKNLKQARKEKQFTQAEVARRSELTTGMISRIETGHTVPSFPVLIKITDVLNVPISRVVQSSELLNRKRYKNIKNVISKTEHPNKKPMELFKKEMLKNKLSIYRLNYLQVPPGMYDLPCVLGNSLSKVLLLLKGEVVLKIKDEQIRMKQGDAFSMEDAGQIQIFNQQPKPAFFLVTTVS